MRRKLAAGNWKMNGLTASLAELDALTQAHPAPGVAAVLAFVLYLVVMEVAARVVEGARQAADRRASSLITGAFGATLGAVTYVRLRETSEGVHASALFQGLSARLKR